MKSVYDYTCAQWRYIDERGAELSTGQVIEPSCLAPPDGFVQPVPSHSELALCLDIAIADPIEAIDMFKQMEDEHKPALKVALKTLPIGCYQALMSAAKGKECGAQLVNLSRAPQWLTQRPGYFSYIGRGNASFGVRASLLHNPVKVRRESDRAHAVDEFTLHRLIPALEGQCGPVWLELRKLVSLYTEHGRLVLGCYCSPRLCHGEPILFVVEGLMKGESPESIVEDLRAELESGKQQTLLTV